MESSDAPEDEALARDDERIDLEFYSWPDAQQFDELFTVASAENGLQPVFDFVRAPPDVVREVQSSFSVSELLSTRLTSKRTL